MPPVSKLSCLGETWIAKANAAQRRGRAGRVKKGLCFKLYTERRHADLMDQRPPEILRVPLEQLCLQIKLLNVRATVKQFLHQALQPPEDHAIQSALNVRAPPTLPLSLSLLISSFPNRRCIK